MTLSEATELAEECCGDPYYTYAIATTIQKAVLAERERCASIAEAEDMLDANSIKASIIAKKIRGVEE